MKLYLPILLAFAALSCFLMPCSFADEQPGVSPAAVLDNSATAGSLHAPVISEEAVFPTQPVEQESSWSTGILSVILSILVSVAALGVRSFKRSADFQELSTKQKLLWNVIAIAVQIAWKRYGREARLRADKDGRKLSPIERGRLQEIAMNEARMLAKDHGIEHLPEIRNDGHLAGAIEVEVSKQKAQRRPTMRAARGGTA